MASPDSVNRALVVEDDGAWQEILCEILTDAGLVVDAAASLEQALSRLAAHAYRLAVVDLSLGGSDHHNQDGMAVLDAVAEQAPDCAAVLLTGFATVELAVSALTEHGALTCLRKETFNRAEFRALVTEVLSIQAPPDPLAHLTTREREVLDLLAQGMTNKEISETLVISPNTVKRHLKSIFGKLEVHTRAAAAAVASSIQKKPGTAP